MEVDFIPFLTNWQEWLAYGVAAWSEGAARAKAIHIRLPFKIRGLSAITLFPFVLYEKMSDEVYECKREHEMEHVKDVRRLGAGVFYAKYLFLAYRHGTMGRDHPMERRAYIKEDLCMIQKRRRNHGRRV